MMIRIITTYNKVYTDIYIRRDKIINHDEAYI